MIRGGVGCGSVGVAAGASPGTGNHGWRWRRFSHGDRLPGEVTRGCGCCEDSEPIRGANAQCLQHVGQQDTRPDKRRLEREGQRCALACAIGHRRNHADTSRSRRLRQCLKGGHNGEGGGGRYAVECHQSGASLAAQQSVDQAAREQALGKYIRLSRQGRGDR